MALWFRNLKTDWLALRRPELTAVPVVFTIPDHNRVILSAVNGIAAGYGLCPGMRLADAKAMVPELQVFEDKPGRENKLLTGIGQWCIRFSPWVALDLPDGLLLDISGCAHLWGGERAYYREVVNRLQSKGYQARAAIADTSGAAWAIARFAARNPIVPAAGQGNALLRLPPAALRLEGPVLDRLDKLGFVTVESLLKIPRSNLRRRFGEDLLQRLRQATGETTEYLTWLQLPADWQERLPCLEPIRARAGIEVAVQRLLEMLCVRLAREGKGIRTAVLRTHRLDGKEQAVQIGTNRATHDMFHLFKLFELQIGQLAPGLGIELFILEAPHVEDVEQRQEALWAGKKSLQEQAFAELLDRLAGKIGAKAIRRYLPREQHWPERSIQPAQALQEKPGTSWRTDLLRPTQLLARPEPIDVSALLPDSPPMVFRYRGETHHIRHAEGPERIEREWWREAGEHRDYYAVEDQHGGRYWLFRLGHYHREGGQWFIHGFFS
ncbi:Y-family DNA polymerase [Mucilaginibacter lacusdianchii]|uniref:Y-family DNA polymerase n=1 Tax=Mucilaginibacter lacusdianchii TaxID=2684211 RepID=UPI001E60C2EA|nr:DNA polymerase Y family protein [Mucilaginibacter sp. JXJ CY 39]